MKTQLSTLLFLILFCLSINLSIANSRIDPVIKLCIDKKCKKPYQIKVSHATWTDVRALFSTPFSTDKDEQDNIVSAIGIIEYDIYHSLASQLSQTYSASDLYTSNTTKNNYRNIKNILNILLDNHLIQHHLMRKTITSTNWLGLESTVLLLQSLRNARLYVLESDGSELGNSSLIKEYKKSTGFFDADSENTNNSLNNDDFE